MQFTFALMNEADVQIIQTWHYGGEYAVYDIAADPEDDEPSELLDRRSPSYTVRDESGEPVGFFSYGTSAQPWIVPTPGIYSGRRITDIGLGMRPDLTGKGLGLAFVNAGLDFAREQFAPASFRLFVLTFNERAIKVYKRAGFKRVRVFTQRRISGDQTFMEMRRKV